MLGLGQWLAMIYPVLVSQLANGKPSRLGTRLPPRQSVLWRIFLVPGRVTFNVSGIADTTQNLLRAGTVGLTRLGGRLGSGRSPG